MNFKYKELIPDETIDIFYDKIERCLLLKLPYNQYVNSLLKLNGDKLPLKIKKLISEYGEA